MRFVASNSSNQQVEITNHEIMRRVVEKHNLQELFKVILLIHMTYTHIDLVFRRNGVEYFKLQDLTSPR